MSLKMECLYFNRQLCPNCQIYIEIGTVLNQQNWAGSWSVAGNLKHLEKNLEPTRGKFVRQIALFDQ
jgi:hypothetical protein